MNTVYFFEDHGNGWEPRTSHEGPLNNGHLWNKVQPLLDQDMGQVGETAKRVLLVEIVEHEGERAVVKAEEYEVKPAKVQLFNRQGSAVGR